MRSNVGRTCSLPWGDSATHPLLASCTEPAPVQLPDERVEDLADLPKGDPRKLAIVRVVRARSTVSSQWLSDALKLEDVSRLSHATSRDAHVLHLSETLERAVEYKNGPFLLLMSDASCISAHLHR